MIDSHISCCIKIEQYNLGLDLVFITDISLYFVKNNKEESIKKTINNIFEKVKNEEFYNLGSNKNTQSEDLNKYRKIIFNDYSSQDFENIVRPFIEEIYNNIYNDIEIENKRIINKIKNFIDCIIGIIYSVCESISIGNFFRERMPKFFQFK
jgi:hypothetical protein